MRVNCGCNNFHLTFRYLFTTQMNNCDAACLWVIKIFFKASKNDHVKEEKKAA